MHEVPVPHINTSSANHGGATQMRTYALPLNSKRLTATNLKRIATGLELPTTSSLDEIQMLTLMKRTVQTLRVSAQRIQDSSIHRLIL